MSSFLTNFKAINLRVSCYNKTQKGVCEDEASALTPATRHT